MVAQNYPCAPKPQNMVNFTGLYSSKSNGDVTPSGVDFQKALKQIFDLVQVRS